MPAKVPVKVLEKVPAWERLWVPAKGRRTALEWAVAKVPALAQMKVLAMVSGKALARGSAMAYAKAC